MSRERLPPRIARNCIAHHVLAAAELSSEPGRHRAATQSKFVSGRSRGTAGRSRKSFTSSTRLTPGLTNPARSSGSEKLIGIGVYHAGTIFVISHVAGLSTTRLVVVCHLI